MITLWSSCRKFDDARSERFRLDEMFEKRGKRKRKKKKITPFDCIKIRSLSIWPDTDQDILLTRNEANNRA